MANHRTGLHKEIASIFDGVPVPKGNGAQQSSYDSAPKRPAYTPPELPHQNYSTAVNTSAPNPQKPVPSPPESIVSEQLKDDITIENYQQSRWQQIFQQLKARFFEEKPGVNLNKQKVMVILISLLSVVLIFMLSRSLTNPVRGTKKPLPAVSAAVAAAAKDKIDWQIPDPYPETLRDPMKFSTVANVQDDTDKPIVKGIIYSEFDSSAVIGNQILRQGDQILGATIVKINKDSVEFEKKGKSWIQKVQ